MINVVARYRDTDDGRLGIFQLPDGRFQISHQTRRGRGVSDPIDKPLEEVMVRVAEEGWILVERIEVVETPQQHADRVRDEWRGELATEMTREQTDKWARLPRARR